MRPNTSQRLEESGGEPALAGMDFQLARNKTDAGRDIIGFDGLVQFGRTPKHGQADQVLFPERKDGGSPWWSIAIYGDCKSGEWVVALQ